MNEITEYTLNSLNDLELDSYSLYKSKDNKNVVQINKEGKNVFLGSKYSVERDINKFISDIGEIDDETVLIVFGLGAGEHILKLESITKYNQILIIEPDANVINIFKETEYSKEILENNRIYLWNYDEITINSAFLAVISDFNVGNINVGIFSNYDKVYEKEYNSFKKKLLHYSEICIYNMSTQMVFSLSLVKQFFNNIKNIKDSNYIGDIKNIYKDFPAIIVSGGPSLSKNIHLLKKVKDRFVIIASSRTLKALLDIGIDPDFVCTIDPGEFSVEFVKNLPVSNTLLAFAEVSNSKTISEFKGRKIFYGEKFNFGNSIDGILGREVDTLWQGGSVAHTCTGLARYLGCNPIILIGQDLAYTDKKYHSDIVNFSGDNNLITEDDNMFFVEDIYGDKVLTNKELDFYRKKFEEYIERNQEVKIINGTEGGANINGAEALKLNEIIGKFSHDGLNKSLQKEHIERLNKGFKLEIIIKNLNKLEDDLLKIKKECKKGIDYSKKIIIKNTDSVDKNIMKNFKKIKKINRQLDTIRIINPLLEPVIYRILVNERFKFNSNDSNTEKIKKIKLQTETMYKAAIDGIDLVLPLIKNTVKDIEDGGENE